MNRSRATAYLRFLAAVLGEPVPLVVVDTPAVRPFDPFDTLPDVIDLQCCPRCGVYGLPPCPCVVALPV